MKSLVRFMAEALTQPKTIELDFTDLEGGKDAKQSLLDLLDEKSIQHTENGESVSLTIAPDKADDAKTVYDQLMQFVNTIRTSQKRSNNEQYAQKTLSFAKSVQEFTEFFEEIQPETPEDENTNDEDKKDIDAQKGNTKAKKDALKPGTSKTNHLRKSGKYSVEDE